LDGRRPIRFACSLRAWRHNGVWEDLMSMGGYPRAALALFLSAFVGCSGGGRKDTPDGATNQGGEMVCAGDRWGGSTDAVGAIAGCTIITGNLSVTGNELVTVALPLLTRVDGFLAVWGNPLLTRATFVTLESVGGYVDVSANVGLTSLELPVLKNVNERRVPSVYDLVIRDNALPTCQADAIREKLAAHGFRGTVSISNNGGGSCPP
jgi:hypothetical protein